ncbi:MAG: AMP-binding protein [Bacteroidota bacterium]
MTSRAPEVQEWLNQLKAQHSNYDENLDDAYQIWEDIIPFLSEHPFEQHQSVFEEVFQNHAYPPVWMPDETTRQNANLSRWMSAAQKYTYKGFYEWSISERKDFWELALKELNTQFHKAPDSILEVPETTEHPVWLRGAEMNIVDSIFANAETDKVAVLSGSETQARPTKTTYGELETLVNRAANGFRKLGLKTGDNVILFVPLSLESTAAYLGLLKAGMRGVLVADSFSAAEIKRRTEIVDCKAIVTFSSYQYGGKMLDFYAKVKAADAPQAIVIHPEDTPEIRQGDVLWEDFLGETEAESIYLPADAVTTILFSSGTTKAPKAIPWTQLTPIKCAVDAHLHHDVHPEDVVTWTTSMGWMMGPWTLFAGLLNGASVALFYGAGATTTFKTFTVESGVTMLGTIPSLVRVWRAKKLFENTDWSVRIFSSTGEPSNAEDYLYLMSLCGYKAPIIEYCGGTEVGGGYLTGSVLQPASPSTFTTPALGLGVYFLNENNEQVSAGETGQVFLVPPSMGLSQTLLNRDHHDEYFESVPKSPKGEVLRKHGDAHDILERTFQHQHYTFYKSHGRVDDAMNIGGIKVSAVEIETAVTQHPSVNQAAAIAVQSTDGPEKLVLYLVLSEKASDRLRGELQKIVSEELNPLFRISDLRVVESLPRTASNKVMRRSLRKMYLEENAS